MTCKECEQILLDTSNYGDSKGGVPGEGESVLNQAKVHAQTCAVCAAKMSEISQLDDALQQLRISSVGNKAPAAIEASLLTAFRERTRAQGSPITRTFPWRVAWVPAAALLSVAVVIALYSASSLRSPTAHIVGADPSGGSGNGRPVERESPTIASGSVVTPSGGESARNRSNAARTAAAGSIGLAARANQPMRAGRKDRASMPAGDDLSLNGGGSIVRVTLPLSSLVAMGVPVQPDTSDPRVTADVMMDPFGAVTGIRLVEAEPKAN